MPPILVHLACGCITTSQGFRRTKAARARKGAALGLRVSAVIGLLTASKFFELSDFKNSLKSLASAGVAIEGPSQEFERPQSFLDRLGQPVCNRVVPIGQAHDGKLRTVQPELLEPILRRHNDHSSLPPNQCPLTHLWQEGALAVQICVTAD